MSVDFVASTGARKPARRKPAVRSTDQEILAEAERLLRRYGPISWVDPLRTMRWTSGLGCNYTRFRPLYDEARRRTGI
jgi:hypothetical protein